MVEQEIKRFVVALIGSAIIYKFIWDTYTAIQGSWYGPFVYFGMVLGIYYALKKGLKW